MSCAHQWNPSGNPEYRICRVCGSYASKRPAKPEDVYGREYWSAAAGHGTIAEQNYNVDRHRENGLTKNWFTLGNLAGDRTDRAVLEIGCAPGSLLEQLGSIGGFDRVVGIEVDSAYEDEIRAFGHEGQIIWGYFPEISHRWLDDGLFSCVIGLDILEHSFEPEAFIAECARLLAPGGQLLLMSPIVFPDTVMTERFFHPVEHVYVHSSEHVVMMCEDAGFRDIEFSRWCIGHEMVSARKQEAVI